MYIRATAWVASTAYAAGVYVTPPAGYETGFYYRCTVAGTSGAAAPDFLATLGTTFTDGGITWLCAAVTPFFNQKDLEDHISANLVRELLDDDNSGTTDADPVSRLAADATSYVIGAIGGVYDFPIASPYPNELQRLALSAAKAMLAERHPEVMRVDHVALFERIDRQLSAVRTAVRQLDIAPMALPQTGQPQPAPTAAPKARNVGAIIYDGSSRSVIQSADGTENNTLL